MTLQVRSRHCHAGSPFPGATKNGASTSAGRTAYRGREPPQRCQPRHGHPPRGSDNSARAKRSRDRASAQSSGTRFSQAARHSLRCAFCGPSPSRNRRRGACADRRVQPVGPSSSPRSPISAGPTNRGEIPSERFIELVTLVALVRNAVRLAVQEVRARDFLKHPKLLICHAPERLEARLLAEFARRAVPEASAGAL